MDATIKKLQSDKQDKEKKYEALSRENEKVTTEINRLTADNREKQEELKEITEHTEQQKKKIEEQKQVLAKLMKRRWYSFCSGN